MKRITKNLITTFIGGAVILAGVFLMYKGKLNATEFTIMAGVGTALIFAKDDLIKPQL